MGFEPQTSGVVARDGGFLSNCNYNLLHFYYIQDSNADYFYTKVKDRKAGTNTNRTKQRIINQKEINQEGNTSSQNEPKQNKSEQIHDGLNYKRRDVESKEVDALQKFEASNLSPIQTRITHQSPELVQVTTGNAHLDKISRGKIFFNFTILNFSFLGCKKRSQMRDKTTTFPSQLIFIKQSRTVPFFGGWIFSILLL